MQVYILESWKEVDGVMHSELEGVFSRRCFAEAHELRCVNSSELYIGCTFYITEDEVDEFHES